VDTPQSARRLREQLARVRRENQGKVKKRRPPPDHRVKRSRCGPNGEEREHPLIAGLHWLHAVGQALILSGVCFDSQVTYKHWERDGCIGLKLQRVVDGRFGPEGGMWEHRRVPVEICNAQDTRALLGKLFEPSVADLIFASNDLIRVQHHGNN
jgi:hypothetical protein